MLTIQVSKFLDKNYDQVRQDVLDLFIQSKNKVRAGGALTHAVLITIILIYLSNNCNKKKPEFCVCVCPDGVQPLPGSHRGDRSGEKRPHKKEQHCHQKIPSSDRQQQVPAVPARASGEDGEVSLNNCG